MSERLTVGQSPAITEGILRQRLLAYGLSQGGVEGASPPGMIGMFAGTAAPDGWLVCDGSAVSRSQYAALFAAIDTTHGAGDGSTTFNLPDFRDMFPVGAGSTYAVGDTGGAASVTLTTAQMPSHTHSGPSHSHNASGLSTDSDSHNHSISSMTKTANASGSSPDNGGNSVTQGTPTGRFGAGQGGNVDSDSHSHNVTGNTGNAGTGNTGSAGSGNSHENRPPFLAALFIIKT